MDDITIIIADDHPIVRQGLRQVIEEHTGLRVVAEAANGREAIAAIEQHEPTVALFDVDMPEMNGFDAAREVARRGLPPAIVFLTMHCDEDIFNEAVDLGAKGYVLKDSALSDIVDCIKTVGAGRYYASQAMTTFLMDRSRARASEHPGPRGIDLLTATERRILSLIADDLTTREIGEKLFISTRTVEKHRENICRKLDLQGSHSLLKFVLTHKA